MRGRTRSAVIVLALLIAITSIGCVGSADITVHVIYQPSGALTARIIAEGEGPLMQGLIEGLRGESGEAFGQVSLDRQGNTSYITVERTMDNYPLSRGSAASARGLEGISIEANKGLFQSDFRMTWAPEFPGLDTEELGEYAGMIVASAVGFRLRMTLPGEIVESNADNVNGDTATWYLPILSMGQGRMLTARSRLVHRDRITVTAALAGLLAVAVVLSIVLHKRRSRLAQFNDLDVTSWRDGD